jgi:molecular chaperone GrpE
MLSKVCSIRAVAPLGKSIRHPVNIFGLKSTSRFFSDASSNEPATSENKQGQEGQTTEPAKPSDAEIIQKLQNEVKQLKDQVLRAYAESENTRRIAARDVENARSYANTSFAKAILEIADDLERALGTVPAEKRKDADSTFKTLIDGIDLTDKNLQKVLHKFGVVKYGVVDEKFDPNLHEALYNIPDSEKAGTIGAVVKVGYKIKDRVLRPAQVGTRV